MNTWLPSVKLKTIFSLLPNEIKLKTSIYSLEELDSSKKQNYVRKRFFKLRLTDNKLLHLTYGANLGQIYENSQTFNVLWPEHTCKPYFINKKDDYCLFGQEFFDGCAIDDLYNESKLDEDELTQILNTVYQKFKIFEEPSSIQAAHNEFREFSKAILDNNLYSEVDIQIFENEIFPLISKWIEKEAPTFRWSTGDLAARNILVNQDKDFRIIDCEFAHKTHFHMEDWLRLRKFSVGKFCLHPFFTDLSEKTQVPILVINLLKQISLNRLVHNDKNYDYYLREDFFEMLQEISSIVDSRSFFLKSFFTRYEAINESFESLHTLNSNLTNEIGELNLFKSDALKEIAILNKNSSVLKENLSQRDDKILRMQNSFSWKVTTPLRFLRRQKSNLFKDSLNKINFQNLRGFFSFSKEDKKVHEDISSPFEFEDIYSKKLGLSRNKFFDPNCLKIVWLIPDFGVGSGGHTTIFRTIKWLEYFGHQSKIYICGQTHHKTINKAKHILDKYFFKIDAEIDILIDPSKFNEDSDIIVSTSYETCYYSRAILADATRFYFVQDYEPEFAPIGTYYFLAKQTYSFGFKCITAGKWLADKIASVGGEVQCHFELAVDKSIFFPRVVRAKDNRSIPQIAVYSRSGTPRRLSELTVFAFNILAKRKIKFRVVFFGESSLPVAANFQYDVLGILEPKTLASVYCNSDIGCVFSGTNYSLVPLEMMACGLPVIEFDGRNTRATYPEKSVIFSEPNPISVANSLEGALCNSDLTLEIRNNALKYVKGLCWEKSCKQVEIGFLNALRNNIE